MKEISFFIENENNRVYTPPYGVATIQLGDGGTLISDISSEEGFCGICFSETFKNDEVGKEFTDHLYGKAVDDIGSYLQIITNNPASLDVLIEKCQQAKAALLEMQSSEISED